MGGGNGAGLVVGVGKGQRRRDPEEVRKISVLGLTGRGY